MVLYASIQLSLLLCFSITSSYGRRLESAPTYVTSCAAGFTLDPVRHVCAQTVCGENMALDKSAEDSSSEEASCVCKYEVLASGWGRPEAHSETKNLCYYLGERGDCPQGQVLVLAGSDKVKCGVDACVGQQPKNPVGQSSWSAVNAKSNSIFDFTYKGDCYRTETQGFCKEGQVVRFVAPSNTPTCAAVDTVETEGYITSYDPPPGGPGNTLRCGKNLKVNKARTDCVPLTAADVLKRSKRGTGYITSYDPPPGGPGVTLRCGKNLKVNAARNDCVPLTAADRAGRRKREEGYITRYDPPPGGPGNTLRCAKGLKVNRSLTDCVPLTAADRKGSSSGGPGNISSGPTTVVPDVGYITRYDPPPGGPGNTLRCAKGLKVNKSLTDCVPVSDPSG